MVSLSKYTRLNLSLSLDYKKENKNLWLSLSSLHKHTHRDRERHTHINPLRKVGNLDVFTQRLRTRAWGRLIFSPPSELHHCWSVSFCFESSHVACGVFRFGVICYLGYQFNVLCSHCLELLWTDIILDFVSGFAFSLLVELIIVSYATCIFWFLCCLKFPFCCFVALYILEVLMVLSLYEKSR